MPSKSAIAAAYKRVCDDQKVQEQEACKKQPSMIVWALFIESAMEHAKARGHLDAKHKRWEHNMRS